MSSKSAFFDPVFWGVSLMTFGIFEDCPQNIILLSKTQRHQESKSDAFVIYKLKSCKVSFAYR